MGRRVGKKGNMKVINKDKLKAIALAVARTKGISRDIDHVLQGAVKIHEFFMEEVEDLKPAPSRSTHPKKSDV